ncbi:MAG TPA: Lrp/AsnC family transcriptional regulator [Clostridiaceae bacterium]|nr:Lrp/AsnC family transcriptional regulator [Clostridiaceae bacterium]
MDETDKKIIRLLQEDSRRSVTDLAKLVSLSRPSISERVARLVDKGIIEQFTVHVPPAKVGHHVSFFMEVSDLKIPWERIVELFLSNDYVTEIHCVTGRTNYIVRASMPDIETMNAFLSEMRRHCDVVTSIILSSPLPHRPVKVL